MDFLHLGSAPQGFLTHPMIDLSVMNTWTHGLSFCDANDMPPNRLLRKFDSMSTPRVLHAVALAGQLAALVALAHYLLYPPRFVITLDVSEQGPREIFLLIMAAASLSSPWSWRMIPSVLIFLAFILRLPGVPTPGDLSFATLLLAFYFHTIVLHLPNAPGPMFLLNPQSALPLSSLLLHGVTQVFLPIAGYFLPALLFASWLVSNSMQDTFLAQIGFQATPMDSRIIFLLLFATEILLILYAFGMGLLTFRPPLSAHSSRWDRYSGTLGVQARKCFIRSLVTYEKYTFPPPFNLLQLLLIRAPATLLFLYKDGQFSSIRAADRVLWRITVGWIGLLMSGIWLWGFL
ncbi:hypothetical protein BJ138DRAFT_121927 [Hygrophoropsis aurantiaca]|uniref:Uncharacterized protein n=1 Tax=Hygrophoropsis aurantiaca TaxID=72124 RepID=A0ACB8AP93_9AGAM|nr:hypothetical protein BJ138DRAFT_121927 [Hygrophoropsis aurantiaca]